MRRRAGYTSQWTGIPVPALPGSSVYRAEDFPRHKNQVLKYINGIPLVLDQSAVGASEEFKQPYKASEAIKADHAEKPDGRRPKSVGPRWLEFDRKVLRFYAYFKESIAENALESWRIRKCTILFYLEDGTMQINEPKESNSGLCQGVFLRRHKVHCGQHLVDWCDIHIGKPIVLYGREFTVTGCDDSTKDFLHRKGVQVPPNMNPPEGPYEEAQHKPNKIQPIPSRLNAPEDSKKEKFHKYDRKVLCFQCCWDDSHNLYGDKLPFVLHYYLVDDTVEIRETKESIVGRDPFPIFLKRRKLPKSSYSVGGRPPSAGSLSNIAMDFHHWKEFRIGRPLKVYGRRMILMDCDGFTRQWYREHLGLEDCELKPHKIDLDDRVKAPALSIPPNTSGIGSEEDSLQTVFNLVPKHPVVQSGSDEAVLRFVAKFHSSSNFKVPLPTDNDRRFVISFFVKDKTLSIYEVEAPNSGVQGGKFLERMKVVHSSPTPTVGTKYIDEQDLYIGAHLRVFGRIFNLLTADTFTLKYMEDNKQRFPVANPDVILQKVKKMVQRMSEAGEESFKNALLSRASEDSLISMTDLLTTLRETKLDVNKHEILTLTKSMNPEARGLKTVEVLQLLGFPV